MMQFVKSPLGINIATIDGEVVVWRASIGNYEQRESDLWTIHILARNVHDAARVAQEVADTLPELDRGDVMSLEMIGTYGLYAADDVTLVPSGQVREWREAQRGAGE